MPHQTYPLGLPQKQQQAQPEVDAEPIEVIEKVDPYTEILLTDAQGNVSQLSLENGDLIITALKGPNYLKRVNLTYGKWAEALSDG
jgi:hypothetical protein